MKASTVNINKSIQSIAFYLVKCVSREKKCSSEDALRYVLKTLTYEMLLDRDTGLYAESPEYVWAMFKEEEKGSIEKWSEE